MDGAALIATNSDAETATLVRAVAPVLDATSGVFEDQAAAETSIVVVTHPITGEDAQELPEASRATATIEIYATQVLYIARGSQAADKIRRADGRTYRVVKVDEQKGGIWLAYAHLEEPNA